MVSWNEYVRNLGASESDESVQKLMRGVGEVSVISSTPGEHDPLFKTLFYQFFKTGLELGFRGGLSHVHFFVQAHEGYSTYFGDILGRAATAWHRSEVVSVLGPAQQSGGDKQNMLIGYVRPWCKYIFEEYAVRFEFSQDQRVWKVTLMSI
ncbi:hypothetical protein HX882_14140 [Pseudomonas gingeri]|uniref:Uncharacterized protein n=1 Tax=Pseudomonas gingeri TaxID=117681 RepID=A0A7Y8C1Z5_9PSED|nr:hypothetical protein [Pseudomonas gingeri]NWB97035.1 hypothetical protein [Pseudomonas gingeri]